VAGVSWYTPRVGSSTLDGKIISKKNNLKKKTDSVVLPTLGTKAPKNRKINSKNRKKF
jgi:hypothetical protein